MNVPFLVQTSRIVSDGQGGRVTAWSTVAAMWGAIEDYYDRVTVKADSDVTHIVTARPRKDIDLQSELRLVFGEKVFVVREAKIVGRTDKRMKLLVRETRYLN